MGRLDDPQAEGKLLLLTADVLTMLLMTAGAALSFLSGYKLYVDKGAVIAFCVFAAVTSTVLHSLSRPWWSIGAAAGVGLIFWRTWEETSPVLEWLGRQMHLLPASAGSHMKPDGEELLPVLLLLSAVLAWLMGLAAIRLRAWYLAALLCLIPLLPAIQTGVLPAWGAMLAAFAGWGSLLLTALYGRGDPDSLGRARLLSLTGMTALLLLLVMSLPMEGYVRPRWATDARTNLILGVRRQLERHFDMEALDNSVLADLGLDLSVPDQGSGQETSAVSSVSEASGSGSGRREDLLSAGPRRYARRRVMSVSTDQPGGGRIYLRGGSLGTYTGDSWEMVEAGSPPFFSEGSGPPEAQPALYPARTAPESAEYTMSIRDIYYQGVHFYPYRLTETGGWTDESGVLTLPNDDSWIDGFLPAGLDLYRMGYVPGGPERDFVPLPEAEAAEEERYRTEVACSYRYLEVPDRARMVLEPLMGGDSWEIIMESMQWQIDMAEGAEREQLEALRQSLREAADSGLTLEDFDTVVELPEGAEQFQQPLTAASRTAALLAEVAEYDPGTPAMEPGEDFVTRFLTEGRGYCIHFATAGALLLRLQGVPARYVTGYVVQLAGQGRSSVMDSDAHAWVEIYLDGYGWYPVEMTPGYAGGESGVELAGAPDEESPEEAAEPEPDEVPEEEAPDPDDSTDPEEEDPSGGESGEAGAGIVIPWRAIGRTALVLWVLGGAYALALLLRRRERTGPDVNRSVIGAYRRYQRVLRLGGVEDERLEELGRKAKFSQHTLTEEERAAAWDSLEQAAERAQKRQKKNLRWLFPLLRPIL